MQHPYACKSPDHRFSRRQVLGGLAGGAAASALGSLGLNALANPAVAAEMKKQRRQMLLIWMDGGMSQLESWDPKPHSDFGGPFRSIPTSVPGVRVSELLEHTSKQMHRLAVLRGMHTRDENHSTGVGRIQRGDPANRGVIYPFIGSAIAKFIGPGDSRLPPYVNIKPYNGGFLAQDAGFLGPKYGCLALGDGKPPENLLLNPAITPEVDAARQALRRKADERFARGRRRDEIDANSHAYDMAAQLMARADLFDDSNFTERDRDRYGRHDLGRHLLLARKLLEQGVTFVKVTSFHWDTHGDNFNLHQTLVPQFDKPFAALLEDLDERGMLENTLVVAMSEFGRTPRINGHVGRDHWPEAWSVAMAGCGLARGAVLGRTDDRGVFVTEDEYDIGDLFHTWFECLGLKAKKLEYDNHGQPLPVADEGCGVIRKLFV